MHTPHPVQVRSRILLVDDDLDMLETLAEGLGERGFDVVTARSGEAALRLARACGVDRTAAAVVLDRERRIVYRGRVDDQHGYGGARAAASREDLREALASVLDGRAVAVPETAISGCNG